jgi:hypothetical protein
MNAFETVVASILQRQGFWTQTNVKVLLSKEEKRRIDRASTPRWELDVVAYSGRDNELRIVECKSFLDSAGVDCALFNGTNLKDVPRYKLFCDDTLREVVLSRLERQLVDAGFCPAGPKIKLCLAAGKIQKRAGGEAWLQKHFNSRDWILYGPAAIKRELEALQDSGYENDVASIVAKILLRGDASFPGSPDVDDAV